MMIDTNPLREFPSWRQRLYRAHWFLVAAHGAWMAYLQATDGSMPAWGFGVGAVLLYVGALLTATADQNVVRPLITPVHQSHTKDDLNV